VKCSGKTHTLIGNLEDPEQRGLVSRMAEELMYAISSPSELCNDSAVTLSIVEIYCERIRCACAVHFIKGPQEISAARCNAIVIMMLMLNFYLLANIPLRFAFHHCLE
jgi:Kinesin motor domain